MKDLKVAVVQCELAWENPAENRNYIEKMLHDHAEADVIVLPEMFTTGFSMNAPHIAELHDLESMASLQWLRSQAKRLDAAITGSIAVNDQAKFYNRMYWVTPDGDTQWYDKRHLFTFANEDRHYTPGEQTVTVSFRGWKLCLQVCYDLRFPEGARNAVTNESAHYDVLIYVANWPEVRRAPWSALLIARAIENQCYLLASNRVGTDGNNISYSGDSVIIDAKGDRVAAAHPAVEAVITAQLSWNELEAFREKFPVLHDRKV